jgi:hypothetical protein
MPTAAGLDRARASAPGGDADGTIAFATDPSGPIQLLYLIDTKNRAFTIYRVDSTQGNVRLVAARQYGWDLKLSDYNSIGLGPTAIEAMVNSVHKSSNPR